MSSRRSARGGEIFVFAPLDIFRRRSARGGEILLLTPGWTCVVVVRRVEGLFCTRSKLEILRSCSSR